MQSTLTIRRPDDFHLHLRDGAQLASVIGDSAARFARAIVMPNLKPPVTTVADALAYRARILAALPVGREFTPLMTLYLTDRTGVHEIRAASECEHVYAVKLYPAGATTHSEHGVTSIEKVYPAIGAMERAGLPLLVHGEVADPRVDVFDRETAFIDTVLSPLLDRFPALRVVFEHITTARAARFVHDGPDTLAATITPQHLMYSRSALFQGGMHPHLYCLPLPKREEDRRALVEAATGGHPRFFLGTDSAPYARSAKEHPAGCAGVYSAHGALEFYVQVFEEAGALDRLEAFASWNGARFYGLPPNAQTLTLERRDWRIPESLPFADEEIVPLGAGDTCRWRIAPA